MWTLWKAPMYSLCMTRRRRPIAQGADELVTEGGWLERPLPATWRRWEGMAVDGDDLVATGASVAVRPGRPALEDFLPLTTADSGEVAAYARRWGLLGACSHGLVRTHGPEAFPSSFGNARYLTPVYAECRASDKVGVEAITVWRYWAETFGAMLRTGSVLRHLPAKQREWAALFQQPPWEGLPVVKPIVADVVVTEDKEAQRARLAMGAEGMLHCAGVRPSVTWGAGTPDVGWHVEGLLGWLAMQVVLALSGVETWAVCASCGAPHRPRAYRRDRAAYCEACRTAGVPEQRATAAYRARKRQGRNDKDSNGEGGQP